MPINDKNQQPQPVKQNDPALEAMPLGRLFLAAGLCIGIFIVLLILKNVFNVF